MQLGLLFDRVYRTEVGRVLIDSVRLETTVVHGERNVTMPDTLHGGTTTVMFALARSTGAPGILFLDLRRGARLASTGLPRNHEVSLVHELVHAVHITWGGYAARPYTPEQIQRYQSNDPEETRAWIVENMFRIERGYIARRTYLGDGPLPPGEQPTARNTGIPLREVEREAVAHLRRQAPAVAQRLRALPTERCPYNPFRAW